MRQSAVRFSGEAPCTRFTFHVHAELPVELSRDQLENTAPRWRFNDTRAALQSSPINCREFFRARSIAIFLWTFLWPTWRLGMFRFRWRQAIAIRLIAVVDVVRLGSAQIQTANPKAINRKIYAFQCLSFYGDDVHEMKNPPSLRVSVDCFGLWSRLC